MSLGAVLVALAIPGGDLYFWRHLRRRGADVHQGRRADPLQQLRRVPSPGAMAPMSLMTYDDARPWARDQAEGGQARDAAVGRRSDDRQVRERSQPEQAEIDTIAAWVDAGAPEGNQADLPKAPTFAEGWSIGKPD